MEDYEHLRELEKEIRTHIFDTFDVYSKTTPTFIRGILVPEGLDAGLAIRISDMFIAKRKELGDPCVTGEGECK